MKVIQSLKLDKQNIALFKKLPCVKSVETDSSGNPTVTLHPSSTRGSHVLRNGDYLVCFASHLWQRFGLLAFERLIASPQ